MIKTFNYRKEWGISLARVKKTSMFYDSAIAELYKEGRLEKRFNPRLNQSRLYEVDHVKTEKDKGT